MSKKPQKSPIPVEYLMKIGTSEVIVHGAQVIVHITNSCDVIDKVIAEFRSTLKSIKAKIIGLDFKTVTYTDSTEDPIVLCTYNRCLIIHLKNKNYEIPESLHSFFQDPEICFVGSRGGLDLIRGLVHKTLLSELDKVVVTIGVGELASNVLKQPALRDFSLADLAKEVGASYDGPKTANHAIQFMLMEPQVLSQKQIISVMSDAYAYFKIGYKLLGSL